MSHPARLFNRNFLLLWQGQLISKLGNEAHYIALMFWIKHTTDSASLMGTILMLSTLPRVLLGPFAGAYADRHSRRSMIVVADFVSGIAVLSLAGLLFFASDQTGLILIWMFCVTVILGIASAFFGPALQAAIPDIVPRDKLAGANSVYRSTDQIASFFGLGAGGVLFRLLGAPVLFLLDGLSFVVSGIFSSFTSIPQPVASPQGQWRETVREIRRDVADGLRYVWGQPGLRALFLVAAALNFFLTPVGVLMPFFVEDRLKATPDWFGYIMAAFGLGALVGYTAVGIIRLSGRSRSAMTLVGLIATSLLVGTLGLVVSPLACALVTFFIGAMTGFVNINIATILQVTTPSETRGRVFGLLSTLGAGLMPLAMALSGVVADLVHQNIAGLFLSLGILLTLISVSVSFSGTFRRFLAYEAPVTAATAVTEQASQQ